MPSGAVLVRDLQNAVRLLGSDSGELLFAAWTETEPLVNAHWGKILSTAFELQQRKRLTGDEVAALWRAMSLTTPSPSVTEII